MSTDDFTSPPSPDHNLPMDPVNLTNCDREPIHIPGSIQPHGLLLALTEPALTIVQVSANTETLIGIPPQNILNRPLEALLGATQVEHLRANLSRHDIETLNPLSITLHVTNQNLPFDGILHRSNSMLILELEPLAPANSPPNFYHVMHASAAVLQKASSLSLLTQAAAEMVRQLTGFDRVMIYRFHPDWHGEVIAESKRADQEPYLGLHYPASDIPQQARELYRHNLLRLISDVSYQPAPLVPQLNPLTGKPLDLSSSVLRSVSPMHIAYLKNMGVSASMSVSILKHGQLWGLISCHHLSPKTVPYMVRAACEFLGHLLSLQISAQEDMDNNSAQMQVKDILSHLLDTLLQQENIYDTLQSNLPALLSLVNAQGIALYSDGNFLPFASAPAPTHGLQLITWLQQHMHENFFATDTLPTLWPDAASFKEVATGLLAISISDQRDSYLLWFRPETTRVIQWAGDPQKPVQMLNDQTTLHPRASFAAWSQTVHLKSLPWHPYEIDAARTLRAAIIDRTLRTLIVHKSQQLAQLNEQLTLSNQELDAFAYSVSHDLKEPLRGIHNYVHILLEDYTSQIDEDGLARLKTLQSLSQRLDTLIESLLHFSRVGRVELSFANTDLNTIVHRSLEVLQTRLSEEHVQIDIPRPLPTIWCDRIRIGEVFSNLISNAIKYNDKPHKRIEIGFITPEEHSPALTDPHPLTFYVHDNGIGIREKYADAIFLIFKRLHGRDKFGGGTGAGLAIVKRIVERHGGTIWVVSSPGVGSTFYFTLSKG